MQSLKHVIKNNYYVINDAQKPIFSWPPFEETIL